MKLIILTALMVSMFGCSKDKDNTITFRMSPRGFLYDESRYAIFTQKSGGYSKNIEFQSKDCDYTVSLSNSKDEDISKYPKSDLEKAPKYSVSYIGFKPVRDLKKDTFLYKHIETGEKYKGVKSVELICEVSYKDKIFTRVWTVNEKYYTLDGFQLLDGLPDSTGKYGKKKIKTENITLDLDQYELKLE